MPDQNVILGILRHLKTGNFIFDIGPFSVERPKIDVSDDEIEWHLKYLEQTGALTLFEASGAGAITVNHLTAKGKAMMDKA